MTDLATQLLAAVEHGGLQGLTLYKTPDGLWQAATSPDKISWRVAIDADPVAAALKALGAPQAPAADIGDIFG